MRKFKTTKKLRNPQNPTSGNIFLHVWNLGKLKEDFVILSSDYNGNFVAL